jgi:hypothetical protein
MMAKKTKKQKGAVRVPMSQEVKGQGRVRIPEGDYKMKVKSVKQATSEKGNPMLVWTFELIDHKKAGATFRDYAPLTPKALWKLRSILEAMGAKVPDKDFNLTLKKYLGKELGVTVIDEEYENKMYSRIDDYMDLETLAGNDVDDDEDEDDEDDETEDSEDTDDEDDEDEDTDDEDDEDLEELDVDGL